MKTMVLKLLALCDMLESTLLVACTVSVFVSILHSWCASTIKIEQRWSIVFLVSEIDAVRGATVRF